MVMHIFLRVHRSFNLNGDNILLLSVSKTGTILFNFLLAEESNVLQLIFFFLKIQMTYGDNLTFL